jgi:predicted transcriptional regulator
MKQNISVSLDSELLSRTRELARKTHRTFSGTVELSLQKFFESDDHD